MINEIYNENKVYFDNEFKNIFSELNCFKNDGVVMNDYAILILWTKEDWLNYIPLIDNLSFRNFKYIYVEIVTLLLNEKLFKMKNAIDIDVYKIRLWQQKIDIINSNNRVKISTTPFHLLSSVDLLKLDFSCIDCKEGDVCMLSNMQLGECSKILKCDCSCRLHLCAKHHPYIFDIRYNQLGLSDRYILRDGRIICNLFILQRVNEFERLRDRDDIYLF